LLQLLATISGSTEGLQKFLIIQALRSVTGALIAGLNRLREYQSGRRSRLRCSVSHGEISFLIKVHGNAFSGTASAVFYDFEGRRLRGPLPTTLEAQRVVP
jgi:hypothetical protein